MLTAIEVRLRATIDFHEMLSPECLLDTWQRRLAPICGKCLSSCIVNDCVILLHFGDKVAL